MEQALGFLAFLAFCIIVAVGFKLFNKIMGEGDE